MATNPAAQRLVSSRYALIEPLGKGGMGVVWRARDTILERDVAVKEVALPATVPLSEREALRARVNREARAAARLTHPSVVMIYDVVEEEGISYIVMELVDAPTLAELVKARGPLPPEQAAVIGLDLLAALERAHKVGIVHRDVKPGNVMVPPEGRAKLGDFGIASIKGDPKITTTGMIMGSPSFMAPEQATGVPAGPEVDLWSLGATLYYAVEGEPPFDRGQAIPTLTAVVHDDMRPPVLAGPLAPVLHASMSKSPAERPPHDALRASLDRVILDSGSSAGAMVSPGPVPGLPGLPEVSSSAATVTVEDDWDGDEEWDYDADDEADDEPVDSAPRAGTRTSRGWLLGAAALVVLGLIGGLAFVLLGDNDEPSGRATGAGVAQRRDDRSDKARGGGQSNHQPSAGPSATPSATQSTTPTTSPEPVGDTTSFVIGDTGFALDRPSSWIEVPAPTDADSTDFRDPSTGTYLRVDWTSTPGDDASQAWENLEGGFASRHDDYHRIRIEDVSFKDFDEAALWEFTWSEGGARLHAYDLGLVTNDGEHGFALNLVARAESWEASQPLWRSFLKSFRPAG
jgi:eukaryotic-like serine/threonine-protein kinase